MVPVCSWGPRVYRVNLRTCKIEVKSDPGQAMEAKNRQAQEKIAEVGNREDRKGISFEYSLVGNLRNRRAVTKTLVICCILGSILPKYTYIIIYRDYNKPL